MHRVRLIHWDADESEICSQRLREANYDVDAQPLTKESSKELLSKVPAAVVIDLSRAPTKGRDMGLAIRARKATRQVPLVFVGGDPEVTERIRGVLPDAVFTTWPRIRSALRRAIANPPLNPIKPSSLMAGYSGTPLPKKLGIKPGGTVVLLDAPNEFEQTLGQLPEVTLRSKIGAQQDLIVWFVRDRAAFEKRLQKLVPLCAEAAMWVAWPKQSSGVPTDLTQNYVRDRSLKTGLVDYKVCAIDAVWTGLKFTRRKSSQ